MKAPVHRAKVPPGIHSGEVMQFKGLVRALRWPS